MRENASGVFSENGSDGEIRRRFFNRVKKEEEHSFLKRLEERIKIGEQPEKAILTDRDLREYEKFLQIDAKELEGKKILDLGSGEFQKFARRLTRRFPDTEVVCLDASLARRRSDFLLSESQRGQKMNLVSALFTKLPFQNNSFDVVLSLYGTLYLTTPESKKANLEEIARVLKSGGEARLYPYFHRPYDAPLDEIANSCGVSCEIIRRAQLLPASRGKDHFSDAMRKMSAFGNEGLLLVKKPPKA